MSYPKAEVIRSEIVSCLDMRVRGDLDERSSPFELTMNPKKKRNSQLNASMEKIVSKLSPDGFILLENLRNAWNPQGV